MTVFYSYFFLHLQFTHYNNPNLIFTCHENMYTIQLLFENLQLDTENEKKTLKFMTDQIHRKMEFMYVVYAIVQNHAISVLVTPLIRSTAKEQYFSVVKFLPTKNATFLNQLIKKNPESLFLQTNLLQNDLKFKI